MTDNQPSSARDGLVVEGADAATYLHSQLSQEVRDLAVGDSRWTLLLAPNGHVEVLARVSHPADERFVFDTDEGFGELLEERLRRFMIRMKATLGLVALGAEPVADAGSPGRGEVVGWWGRGTVRLCEGPPSSSDTTALLAARVAAGWPAMGAEIVPGERLPAELGIASVAVNYTKGCYPGQELVERMESRGAAPPRSLRRLTVAPGARAGDPVTVDGAEVGWLTSVAGTAALGFVKRNVDAGTPVSG